MDISSLRAITERASLSAETLDCDSPPRTRKTLYGSFIDIAYELDWMAYALAPLDAMLIPEPEDQPAPSPTDPSALRRYGQTAALLSPDIAATTHESRDPKRVRYPRGRRKDASSREGSGSESGTSSR